MDKDSVDRTAQSLKPSLAFPGCIHYWYVLRVVWRMCHVMSRFCVFVLIWTVMGGVWVPIWAAAVWFYWIIVVHINFKDVLSVSSGSILWIALL
eukprot:422507_1